MLAQNVFGFLYGILISRFFLKEPTLVDMFYISYNIYLLFNMFSVTQRVSIISLIDSHDKKQQQNITISSVYFLFFISSCIFMLSSSLIADLWTIDNSSQTILYYLLLCFAPIIFFQGLNGFFGAYYGVKKNLNYISYVNVIGSFIGLIAFILLRHLGIYAAAIGFLLNHISMFILFSVKSYDVFSLQNIFSRNYNVLAKNVVFKILKSATPYLGFSIFFIIIQNFLKSMDKGVITAFSYSYSLITLITAATTGSIGYTLTIRLAELRNSNSLEYILDYIDKKIFVSLIILLPLLGVLVVCAKEIGMFIFLLVPKDINIRLAHRMVNDFYHSTFLLSFSGVFLGLFTLLAPVNLTFDNIKGFFRFTVFSVFCIIIIGMYMLKDNLMQYAILFSSASFLLFIYQPFKMLHIFLRKDLFNFLFDICQLVFITYLSIFLVRLYDPVINKNILKIILSSFSKSFVFVILFSILIWLRFSTKIRLILNFKLPGSTNGI